MAMRWRSLARNPLYKGGLCGYIEGGLTEKDHGCIRRDLRVVVEEVTLSPLPLMLGEYSNRTGIQ